MMAESLTMLEGNIAPLLEDNDLEMAKQAWDAYDTINHQQEKSPAYQALHDAGLIVHGYRLKSSQGLDLVPGNSTVSTNMRRRSLAYTGGLVIGGLVYDALVKHFNVRDGCVRPGEHSDGSFFFFGPGVHCVNNLTVTVGNEISLLQEMIVHGNRTIVTVPQGNVGLAFDRGQPVLLAPGLHQWKSNTMKLEKLIDLSADVIRIGPFTLLTVDEGYAAITQNNGKQVILNGGATHMLTHRNWKFEKLISLKIHTDDLGRLRATSADNVCLDVTATVNWRVADPELAARMAADTMTSGNAYADGNLSSENVSQPSLQKDVLKQAMASLAATIGSIRYADDLHISAQGKVSELDLPLDTANGTTEVEEGQLQTSLKGVGAGVSEIFSLRQMSGAVKHANDICSQYGVGIVSINVISAIPVDPKLDAALSAGAVAAAMAQQAEIAARGNAKARLVSAESEAEATRINARALADAERLQSEGKKDAAALLEHSTVAIDLAKLERTGQILGERTSFFFGAGPAQLPALLSNPNALSLKDSQH